MLIQSLQACDVYQLQSLGVLISSLFLIVLASISRFRPIKSLRTLGKNEPTNTAPMLPYRIPFIGHTIAFLINSEKLISYGRQYFGNTRRIFAINLGNTPIYILTSARDVAMVHSKPDTFEFTGVLKSALMALGASKKAADDLWAHRVVAGSFQKGVIPGSHEHQIRQNSGANLKVLLQHACEVLEAKTSPENIARAQSHPAHANSVNIIDWTRETIIGTMQSVYFGPELAEIDSSIPRLMMEFSDVAWQAWYGLPWFLRRKQTKICNRLLSCYKKYLEIAPEDRVPTAWFTHMFEKDFKTVLDNTKDQTALLLFFQWGISMNPADAAGWLVGHIASNADLMREIREETKHAIREDGTIDTFYLVNSCPVLISVWYEVLRYYVSVTTRRNVTENAHLGNNYFKKGSVLLFSARQLALDEEVFGENAGEFDHTRFLKNPELQHSESLRPFGGGKTICPGRHLAMHTACALVTIMLHRYTLSPSFPQSFPRAFDGEPSIGVMRTRDDLHITLKEKA